MKRMVLKIILALSLTLPMFAVPSVALACPSGSSPQGQALQGIGQNGCDDSGVTNVVHSAVTILSFVVGIIAVIMIIVAGFKYITSGGEQQKVANAKSTLLFALIGVAIAALAQVLVHFVLYQTNKAAG
jgi:ABC-type Fe3+-siderophore transport system permease subunit